MFEGRWLQPVSGAPGGPRLSCLRPPTLARLRAILGLLVLWVGAASQGADWPQAGYDAAGSAASPHALPEGLRVRWRLALPAPQRAWPEQPRLAFDACYRPIVVHGLLIFCSPNEDCLVAYDLSKGAERWRFFANGPLRLPPASDLERVYAGSDDGYLYALGAADGRLRWRHKVAPVVRRVLGNGRLIDTWAVRGAPVLQGGRVYTAGGIWPFMGVFVTALEAERGVPLWANSGDGASYSIQPHNAAAFAGIAPQGQLAISGSQLLIPNGRAPAAVYELQSGRFLHCNLNQRLGGYEVAAAEGLVINSGALLDQGNGQVPLAVGRAVVVDGQAVYALHGKELVWYDLPGLQAQVAQALARRAQPQLRPRGRLEVPPLGALIKAGPRLYAGGENRLVAYELPLTAGAKPVAQWAIEGQVLNLVAGGGCLVASTREGGIQVCGAGEAVAAAASGPSHPPASKGPAAVSAGPEADQVRALLAEAERSAGWALVLGASGGALARELIRQSAFQVVLLESDSRKVQALRAAWQAEGVYGERLSVLESSLSDSALLPYFASLVIGTDAEALGDPVAGCAILFRALHPYHGVAYLPDAARAAAEACAAREGSRYAGCGAGVGGLRLMRRNGPPGAGDWTHEHGDEANTRVARDERVRAPLGLLWYGGASHEGLLPRHGHGPQPQVLAGRLFIEGPGLLRALDCYTGRRLWEAAVPGLGASFDCTHHQAGANASGGNLVSLPDGLYLAHEDRCEVLDPATGRRTRVLAIPPEVALPDGLWSYLNAADSYLVGGTVQPRAAQVQEGAGQDEAEGEGTGAGKPPPPAAPAGSRRLFVLERASGRLVWSAEARGEFRNNGICIGGGRLYALDRAPGVPGAGGGPERAPFRIVAFDLASGQERWSTADQVFGTWLSYSAQFEVLIESGRNGRDTLPDEAKGMRALDARTGRVLWHAPRAIGPGMIRGEMVFQGQGALDLETGKVFCIPDPLTGQERPWSWKRTYGCDTPAAGRHLMTFRSGAAGYYDLERMGGTGNFGGFRSGCSHNLVQAGGILSAPDYTRTCTCSYHLQTSLALVPDPQVEHWTSYGQGDLALGRIQRVGLNLGAVGDRVDERGVLWLEWPASKGESPAVRVETDPESPEVFRRHSSTVAGDPAWVVASGVRGLRSLQLLVNGKAGEPRAYTVRLYFLEVDGLQAGQRLMEVRVQGKVVVPRLDIAAEAGGSARALVKEFRGVVVEDALRVELSALTPAAGTVLCGVELGIE